MSTKLRVSVPVLFDRLCVVPALCRPGSVSPRLCVAPALRRTSAARSRGARPAPRRDGRAGRHRQPNRDRLRAAVASNSAIFPRDNALPLVLSQPTRLRSDNLGANDALAAELPSLGAG